MTDSREFSYGRAEFDEVRSRLYQLTGIRLADSKDSMVYSRLVRRLRALKLRGFKEYLALLDATQGEEENFINALTTNLTSFFREPHHFNLLKSYLLANPGKKRIWCAASSTGEEPYSIAMTVAEAYGRFDAPVEIIASDIDSQVLQVAAAGIYPIERIKSLSNEQKKYFFQRGKGKNEGKVRVVSSLSDMISFCRINLLDQSWGLTPPIDVIFCRNVMIYFDKLTQQTILQRMINLMPENGLYVAGHSENFSHLRHLVEPTGKTTYKPVKRKESAHERL